MTGPTHIAFGVAGTLAIARLTGFSPEGVQWLCVLFGSLAPDIDTSQSTISRPGTIIKPFIPRFVRVFLDFLGKCIARGVEMLFGHRNAVHWPMVGVVFCVIGYVAGWGWLVWFGVGYVFHILGDCCTSAGAPLFGPFLRRDFSFFALRTGSWLETVVFLLLAGFVCWQGVDYLPENTQVWLRAYGSLLRELVIG